MLTFMLLLINFILFLFLSSFFFFSRLPFIFLSFLFFLFFEKLLLLTNFFLKLLVFFFLLLDHFSYLLYFIFNSLSFFFELLINGLEPEFFSLTMLIIILLAQSNCLCKVFGRMWRRRCICSIFNRNQLSFQSLMLIFKIHHSFMRLLQRTFFYLVLFESLLVLLLYLFLFLLQHIKLCIVVRIPSNLLEILLLMLQPGFHCFHIYFKLIP